MKLEYEECDEYFLEKVEGDWKFCKRIDTYSFLRLLAIAKRCKSIYRVEEENEWLRKKIDNLILTDLAK